MKTTGINTTEQMDKIHKNSLTKQEQEELSLKSMLISCFAYGSIEPGSRDFETYIKPYKNKMNSILFNEVYEEQKQFFKDHCTVKHNTFTDCEGLSYNEILVS